MDTVRGFYSRLTSFRTRQPYDALENPSDTGETEPLRRSSDADNEPPDSTLESRYHRGTQDDRRDIFSWIDYAIFLLLGVAMLWAWNMFLAAGPYFQKRFRGNNWILRNFQPAELSVSTVVNLAFVLVLTNLQAKASYPKRIIIALILNVASFTLLAISTKVGTGVSAGVYFGFLMAQVFISALATGMLQNGVFAFVAGYGREEYTQAIMTGQAVAGVTPCVVQILSVLTAPPANALGEQVAVSSTAAFAYFLTATIISLVTLLAFLRLAARKQQGLYYKGTVEGAATLDRQSISGGERKKVPLLRLLKKTRWLALAVFLTFAITMIFPVFTQQIQSVRNRGTPPWISSPSTFIPIAFLFWNSGDLIGRVLTAIPAVRMTSKPRLVFTLAVSRIIFLPLYHLCNIKGKGAVVRSDIFYLVIVQLLFGVSNGFIGSSCMMGAVEYVDLEEREATGGFMGMCLIAGLAVGSLLSFLVA